MASVTQWEVVGKNKKNKGASHALSKSQKKQFIEKMPRIEANAPVKEDKTIYTAFLEKEQREQVDRANAASARSGSAHNNVNNNHKKLTVQKKKKPENEGKKEKMMSLDAAIEKIDKHDLEGILHQSQLRFPDNQDVWMKEIASYLNLKLEKVVEPDPTFSGKSTGYPLEKLSGGCEKVLQTFVKKFPSQNLEHVFYHCVQTMLTESMKGESTVGYKIFLQLLAHHKPDIALSKMSQYLELLKTHQNRPALCLSILWVLGQCGFKNFKCGLKVWLDLMLPALEVRQVAHYPVEYLEKLVKGHKSMSNGYGVVTLREYFQVLDVVFSPNFNLSNDLRRRLTAMYPHIKDLAYGENPSHSLRTFFPSYLTRFSLATSQAVKTELLGCLVKCLTTDQQSFSVWCQLYTKHLGASGHLLEYINHSWPKLSAQFDKKLLRETLRSFSVTNDEMEAQGRSREGLALCQAATKELIAKLTQSSFPWGLLIFFFVSLVASIVIYDVMSSQHLRMSRTVRFLEHYGVLTVMEQAWGRIHTFMAVVMNWLKLNCPVYYAYVVDTVGPFLTMVWAASKDLVVNAELTTRPHRAWVGDRAWNIYVWVYELSPETWAWCGDVLWLSWEVLKDYTIWIWKHSLHLSFRLEHWFTEHVLTGSFSKESLQASAKWGLARVQDYSASVWSWFNTHLFQAMK